MSVLLVSPPPELGRAVIDRLVSQEDAVRVVEPRRERIEGWREHGAHVAHGAVTADLVERAAQGARTLVLFDTAELSEILDGAKFAGVGRIVVCTIKATEETVDRLASYEIDYVLLATGRLRRPGPEAIAAAIDAADDLEGNPRMIVDLRRDDYRRRLRISEGS